MKHYFTKLPSHSPPCTDVWVDSNSQATEIKTKEEANEGETVSGATAQTINAN